MLSILPTGYGEELREDDVRRHQLNREQYGDCYDAWSIESPQAMSEEYSADIRERIKEAKRKGKHDHLPAPLRQFFEVLQSISS